LSKAERLEAAEPFGLLAAVLTQLPIRHAARGLVALKLVRSPIVVRDDLPLHPQNMHIPRRFEGSFVDLERFTNERLT
jgi:hypothetical protein